MIENIKQGIEVSMKKMIFALLLVLGTASANASIIESLVSLADRIEARNCGKQLKKQLKKDNKSIKYDLRYLYHLDSSPLVHVFAVYEDGLAEPVEIATMVKQAGEKCSRY